MSTTTPLLGLTKPALTDQALITVLDTNLDILDNAVMLTGTQTLVGKTLTTPHMTGPTIDSSGLVVTAGDVSIAAGALTVSTGASNFQTANFFGDVSFSTGVGIGSARVVGKALAVNGATQLSGNMSITTGGLTVVGNTSLCAVADSLGFFGTGPIARQTIAGSRSGGAALTSLLLALASYGLIVDGSSA